MKADELAAHLIGQIVARGLKRGKDRSLVVLPQRKTTPNQETQTPMLPLPSSRLLPPAPISPPGLIDRSAPCPCTSLNQTTQFITIGSPTCHRPEKRKTPPTIKPQTRRQTPNHPPDTKRRLIVRPRPAWVRLRPVWALGPVRERLRCVGDRARGLRRPLSGLCGHC
jgi:hypothetical protein